MPVERPDHLPFSELIDRAIAGQSLSLSDVARRVDQAAKLEGENPQTSKQQVARWRHGPQVPQPQTVRWLAAALHRPVEELAAVADQQRQLAHGRGAKVTPVSSDGGGTVAPQLAPHASWSALFGAAVRRLRMAFQPEQPLTEEEFGRLVKAGGASVRAIEAGFVRPHEDFVAACERLFPEAAVLLRAILPFARAEWDTWDRRGALPPRGTVLSPAELIAAPQQALDPSQVAAFEQQLPEALQLGREAEASTLPSGALETIDRTVDRLCRDYPTTPPGVLQARVERRLREIRHYLRGKLTLEQHRHLLVAGGWLTILLACLQFDIGDVDSAEASRDIAFQLARESGHQELAAWSFELLAWFSVVAGRYADSVEHARSGLEWSPNSSAGVQLAVQQARALSRLGDRREAEQAMRRAAGTLAKLPVPAHPEHHFVFDASKLSFYASTCYTWLGHAEAAEEHAREVVSQCLADPDTVRWPVRLAETRVDMGLIAVRRRQLDEATHLGGLALASQRKSGSTLERITELDAALRRVFPDAPEAREFHEQVQAAQQALRREAST